MRGMQDLAVCEGAGGWAEYVKGDFAGLCVVSSLPLMAGAAVTSDLDSAQATVLTGNCWPHVAI